MSHFDRAGGSSPPPAWAAAEYSGSANGPGPQRVQGYWLGPETTAPSEEWRHAAYRREEPVTFPWPSVQYAWGEPTAGREGPGRYEDHNLAGPRPPREEISRKRPATSTGEPTAMETAAPQESSYKIASVRDLLAVQKRCHRTPLSSMFRHDHSMAETRLILACAG